MPLDRSVTQYSGVKFVPIFKPDLALELPVNLAPNVNYKRGQLIGMYTSTANDVQTITVTGTPTGGSIIVRAYNPFGGGTGTVTIPYNASSATAQTLLRALLGANVTVTGGALPGTPLVVTGSGDFVSMPLNLMTVESSTLAGGTNPAATIAHTTIGRTASTWGKYVAGASDGTDTASRIICYECTTDSGGRITFGPTAIEGNLGDVTMDAPAYICGYFLKSELLGLDAAAIVDLGRDIGGGILKVT